MNNEIAIAQEQMRLMVQETRCLKAMVGELQAEIHNLRNEMQSSRVNSQWLGLTEACSYLKVGKTTMLKRLAEGEFPTAVKKGRKWMFKITDLNRYMIS
jgi:excisionase family DNA binding protein